SERSGYTAIGTVCNVAARLCAEAKDGQILLSQRVNVGLRGSVVTEQVGALALKGLTQPVVAYNVPLAGSQAAFLVIEGGAPSACPWPLCTPAGRSLNDAYGARPCQKSVSASPGPFSRHSRASGNPGISGACPGPPLSRGRRNWADDGFSRSL